MVQKKDKQKKNAPESDESVVDAPLEDAAVASVPAEDSDPIEAESAVAEAPEAVADSGDSGEAPGDSGDSSSDALRDLLESNYILYASYVNKDRAIPDVDDGLKPVQRRILHTLQTIDDGRLHKVNSVVGETMKYHPHGDASIGGALVVLANKGYFIDKQGNFGNAITGDPPAAGRYIECRLNAFGREVLFNPAVTEYVDSYDGRNREPVVLPAKVPALLMLGQDGVGVVITTCIFPHNFQELLQAEIAILRDEPFQVLPDFPLGGIMDASGYEDGLGSIVVRARIEAEGDKKVIIKELPAYSDTETLIASIERAVRAGKLKVTAINDFSASEVHIEITLQRGVYAEETIQALYAYTECQKTLHSKLTVIQDNQPRRLTVSQVLRRNVERLRAILKAELELDLKNELEAIQKLSLERIFIENRIYKRIEKCVSIPKIQEAVKTGLEPFRQELVRDVTDEDVNRLLQIPIRRISLYDLEKSRQEVEAIQKAMEITKEHLAHPVEYAIEYLQGLLTKYGPLYPRRTQIVGIQQVNRREIARRDVKVYHDRVNGFVGTAVKSSSKDAEPILCTEFDRLLAIKGDGTCQVIAVEPKTYVGTTKYLFLYDKDQVYSILYRNKKEGTWFAKRFQVGTYILAREYHLIPDDCIIEALYTRAGVVVSLELATSRRRAFQDIRVEFDQIPLRGRESRGFKLTHYQVVKVNVLEKGGAPAVAEKKAEDPTPEPTPVPKPETPVAEEPAAEPAPEPAATEPAKPAPAEPAKPEEPAAPEALAEPAKPEEPKPRPKFHQDDLPFFL
jgi:topoisomerase IV subunit A